MQTQAEVEVTGLAQKAQQAAARMAVLTADDRRRALLLVADYLRSAADRILAANEADVAAAEAAGIPAAVVKRLNLRGDRFETMVRGVESVAGLPDPVGEVIDSWHHPQGMEIRKVRAPLGVIGLIYESRPNVTVDASVLCLKAGNAVLLKGGSEAERTNTVLVETLRAALASAGFPEDAVAMVPGGRAGAQALMRAVGLVDVLIPRGGANLIKAVVAEAQVPVIETGAGVCHVYIHEAADAAMAEQIVLNAKLSNPAVCNAVETLLVDRSVAPHMLPPILDALHAAGVALRGCETTCELSPHVTAAQAEDWAEEYLDLTLAVRVVDDIDAALDHIAHYGTRHSEAIVTGDAAAAERFLNAVDAACVYWNASTRFTDGGEFGFGAEIGISTQKLHARGPMAVPELTSYRYVVIGDGQVR